MGRVLKLPGARVDAGGGHGELADDFLVEVFAEGFAGLGPVVRGIRLELVPEKLFPDLIGNAQQALGVIRQIRELTALPFVVIGRRALRHGRRGGCRERWAIHTEGFEQRHQGDIAAREHGHALVAMDHERGKGERLGEESAGALEFRLHLDALGRFEPARGGAGAAFAWRGRALDVGDFGILDDELARGDEAGDLGIAEFAEQAEGIPVDRLFPQVFARAEIAADEGDLEALIERGAVEGEQAALAVTGDAGFERGVARE